MATMEAQISTVQIGQALDELMNACPGFTGHSGIKRLLQILSETIGSFVSQYDKIIIEQEEKDRVCIDANMVLANERQ